MKKLLIIILLILSISCLHQAKSIITNPKHIIIYFEKNSYQVSDKYKKSLDSIRLNIISALKNDSMLALHIYGHTNYRESNQRLLSAQRAVSVLKELNIPDTLQNNISIRCIGSRMPIITETNNENYTHMNQRVQLIITEEENVEEDSYFK